MEMLEQSAPLALELDGPDVGLETVDAYAALRLASAYVSLLATVVQDQLDNELRFEGLHVNSGCLEVVTRAVPAFLAWEADAIVATYEAGASIPHGLKGSWGVYQRAVQNLPLGYGAKRFLAGEERQLLVPICEETEHSWASLEVRARLLRVGGKSPTARFESGSEASAFSLELTHEVAVEISRYLYEELDIYAMVQRDAGSRIIAGKLDWFAAIPDDTDAMRAWHQWYQENGCFWDRSGRDDGAGGAE